MAGKIVKFHQELEAARKNLQQNGMDEATRERVLALVRTLREALITAAKSGKL